MNFMTVREAAQRWNLSQRAVQKYCAQGLVTGAQKFGAAWQIPDTAPRPSGAVRPEELPGRVLSDIMPLLNTPFTPGRCQKQVEGMKAGPRKEIARAEYAYFSGNAEEAVRRTEPYRNDPDMALRLSACLLSAYANLSTGNTIRTRESLARLQEALSGAGPDTPPAERAAQICVAAVAAVLLHLPLPKDIPPAKEYLPLLPPGLRMFAIYVMAHYAYLKKEYERSLGIVEGALAVQGAVYPIPTIYLHLVAVMDHMSLRQTEQAQTHLLAAWELARPDDLIEPFGEHHGLLGGMLESVLKKDWPEDFKRIIAITYRFSAGWRRIHNPDTGHDVAGNLTTTEFTAAMLAARGWTNQEIAEQMNISVNTVKRHLSAAMQKLNVQHRQELSRYMLQ